MENNFESHCKYKNRSNLINKFPEEVKKWMALDTEEAFEFFLDFYNPITKDLIAAYIYQVYAGGLGIFGSADLAEHTLEALDVLSLEEVILLIKKLYKLYKNQHIPYDTPRILIRLYTGAMTVEDVIEEEKEASCTDFQKLINKYLGYLKEGIVFEDLYNMMLYDYEVFSSTDQPLSDIQSHKDGQRKIKALYCAYYLFNERNLPDKKNALLYSKK